MRFYTIALSACLIAPFLHGGELRIEVKDPSGAALQVSGRLENLATGTDQSFETDGQGKAAFPNLAFGRYRVRVAKAQFASATVSLEVPADGSISREITMSLGSQAFQVDVVGTTPLPGAGQSIDSVPAPVQAATARDIEQSGALDLADFLNRRLNGVFVNEVQGNPVQPDVNYRGYTASPLLGTPQGISIYMDGVRLNQPFGDVVSWDLIPRLAISETTLIPGANPLFGLNTLGGAIANETKDGRSQNGGSLQFSGGSFGRKVADMEYGRSTRNGFHAYGASTLFFEDGWRDSSPSNVRQFFGKLGWQGVKTGISGTISYANNSLLGNALQSPNFLARDYASVYTKPDVTANRSPFFNLSARHSPSSRLTVSGNFYYRYIRTRTLNGDINEDSLDQSVYQPSTAERTALAAAGYAGFPTAGENAANTPFPSWRCIAQVLLRDEPAEKCNGLLNRSLTKQHNTGVSGQTSWYKTAGSTRNQFTVGGNYDHSSVDFGQSTQLGYLAPDRGVIGVPAFADGVTGGNEDGVPFDLRVDLHGSTHTASVFATDTLSGRRWNLTMSGRYVRTRIDNQDRIRASGPGSLTGRHTFDRFNPAIGLTFNPSTHLNAYVGYTEANRAPTSIELGCADPAEPCKLPNALAGDPPLKQVVARTVEAGLRSGAENKLRWSLGWFRADNRNDLLFVSSPQSGFGYFKNFGKTLRQGVEAQVNWRIRRVSLGGSYTFLDATFGSREQVNGQGNSTNSAAVRGIRGTEGVIEIQPGNRIPLIPQHLFKLFADVEVTKKFLVDGGMIAVSDSYARGNENNRHQPDGTYYLGDGRSPGYAVVNLGARYQVHRRLEFFVRANNCGIL